MQDYKRFVGSQNYKSIVQEQVSRGLSFEDALFPATDASLFFEAVRHKPVEWKRPREIHDGQTAFNTVQIAT